MIEMTNLYLEATCGEWLGIFEGMSQDPIRVFCIVREFISTIGGVLQQEMEVPSGVHVYKVRVHSRLL